MADDVFENPNIEVTDDTEVPIVLNGAITGDEYMYFHVDNGDTTYTLKKILISELKIYMNA